MGLDNEGEERVEVKWSQTMKGRRERRGQMESDNEIQDWVG